MYFWILNILFTTFQKFFPALSMELFANMDFWLKDSSNRMYSTYTFADYQSFRKSHNIATMRQHFLQYYMCAIRRLRSACRIILISLSSPPEAVLILAIQRLWLDCADEQTDMNLIWAHLLSCRKWCAPTQISLYKNIISSPNDNLSRKGDYWTYLSVVVFPFGVWSLMSNCVSSKFYLFTFYRPYHGCCDGDLQSTVNK